MEINKRQIAPNVLRNFAQLLGTELKDRRLEIPEKFGKGYCAGYVFNEQIRMLVLNYKLNKDFIVENPDIHSSGRMILFKFQNIFPKTETESTGKQIKAMPSVLIATSTMNTEVIIPIDTTTASINIEVDANYLNGLVDLSGKSPVLQGILQNTQPLLFEQMMYPSLQKIVDEIVHEAVDETFELFFLRVKAEELVCRLLMELEKRDEKQLYPLNTRDIQTLYKVRLQMLAHPETPPVIHELADCTNMSTSKLKRLFKQIFGNSIFSYYQEFRMKEAARLLTEEKLSVSEVGYQLGFTNLSHFTRVFKDHTGLNPKQYSRTVIKE